MRSLGSPSLSILFFVLALFFSRYALGQSLTSAGNSAVQISVRALQQSRPGEMELPRVLTLKGMVKVSRSARTRAQGQVAIQLTSEPGALVKGARRSLWTLKHLGIAIGSLYRGKGYVPPGINYFAIERRKPSDRGFQEHLRRSGLKPNQVLDITEMTIAFENASDLYLAVEGLLRADQRGFLKMVGFTDTVLTPRMDGDRSVVVYLQMHHHVSTLRLELSPVLKARIALRGDRRMVVRRQAFQKAFSMCEKNYASHRTRVMRFNVRIAPEILKQHDALSASIQNLEANRSVLEARGLIPRPLETSRPANAALNLNPDGTLCPNWNQVSVDHNMSSADKFRTFIWGLSQPPCSADRIRSGHLLYQKLTETYAGFKWATKPEDLAQQQLLKSVYFATADYLRARPTAPQNQMCRPEEKIRIYRGVGAMPLVRDFGAKTGIHLAPLFSDQLVWGLRGQGLVDENGFPLVPNRDVGELSSEHRQRMSNLTWDFIEGVPHGWKFVLGLQRSSYWSDQNKDGIPDDEGNPGPMNPLPFPGPVILSNPGPGGAVLEVVNPGSPVSPVVNGPLDGTIGSAPEPIPEEAPEGEVDGWSGPGTNGWNEPGKNWYKLNGQLQRVLAAHTSVSTFSPFLSASFSENMGRGYGPMMIVMDVCPERILPNFAPSGGFVGEEELYIPFFVLPEEIVRIEGRECWLARSRPGLDKLSPEEQQKQMENAEKICKETYHKDPGVLPESTNRVTLQWRSYFRNFLVERLPSIFHWMDPLHSVQSQQAFYGRLAQGLKSSPLNPSGEMTLARWRDISRRQVRGFYSCDTTKRALARLAEHKVSTQQHLDEFLKDIEDQPDPNAPSVEPPASPMVEKDMRLEAIKQLKIQLQQIADEVAAEKKAAAHQCGSL